jgi:hypothetical protein
VPPAAAIAATAVELTADAPSSSPTLALHYRTAGTSAFARAELVRQGETKWVVVVPATSVAAPGLEYYLTAGDTPVFATPAWPHTTPVNVSESDDRRARDLLRTASRKSRLRAAGEWVDYGTRKVDGVDLKDSYYRIDADFSYRLLAYPLEEIKVGYTGLIGQTQAGPNEQFMCGATVPCTVDAGYKVAGWFEVGLAPVEGVRFDLRASVMATAEGFAPGGRGEARLGVLEGNHVAAGVEYMADVGVAGYFRLGWGTVPSVPMSATVEITNVPLSTRDTGVRLFYDVAREVGGGVRIGARVGYAARTQQVAGFTGGGNVTVDF